MSPSPTTRKSKQMILRGWHHWKVASMCSPLIPSHAGPARRLARGTSGRPTRRRCAVGGLHCHGGDARDDDVGGGAQFAQGLRCGPDCTRGLRCCKAPPCTRHVCILHATEDASPAPVAAASRMATSTDSPLRWQCNRPPRAPQARNMLGPSPASRDASRDAGPRRASWETPSTGATNRILTLVASSRARRASAPFILHQPRDLTAASSSGASKLPAPGASKIPGAWMDTPSSASKPQSASWTRGRVPREERRTTTPAKSLAMAASSQMLLPSIPPPSKDALRLARSAS